LKTKILGMTTKSVAMTSHSKSDDNKGSAPEGRADRHDEGKLRFSISPFLGYLEVMRVAEAGAVEYAPNNFRKGLGQTNLINAALRHIFKHLAGQDIDPANGCLHMAEAAWNLLTLLEQTVRGMTHLDDRYPFGPKLRQRLEKLFTDEGWEIPHEVQDSHNVDNADAKQLPIDYADTKDRTASEHGGGHTSDADRGDRSSGSIANQHESVVDSTVPSPIRHTP